MQEFEEFLHFALKAVVLNVDGGLMFRPGTALELGMPRNQRVDDVSRRTNKAASGHTRSVQSW